MTTLRSTVPGWAWALLTWLVVVAAASTFGWLAISRAGDRVLASPAAPLPASAERSADAARGGEGGPAQGGASTTGAAAGGAAPGSAEGTATAGPPAGDAGGAAPGAAVESPPAQDPGGGAPPAGPSDAPPAGAGEPSPDPIAPSAPQTGVAPPPAPPAQPVPSPAPAPAPAQRTVAPPQRVDASSAVSGGQVRVTCTGEVIELNGATPSNGWVMKTDVHGTREVRVEFRSQEAGTSKVRATCAAGVPQFRAENAGD